MLLEPFESRPTIFESDWETANPQLTVCIHLLLPLSSNPSDTMGKRKQLKDGDVDMDGAQPSVDHRDNDNDDDSGSDEVGTRIQNR